MQPAASNDVSIANIMHQQLGLTSHQSSHLNSRRKQHW